jgi:peptidoglycan/LPS O-acetylase OafA/YrhL
LGIDLLKWFLFIGEEVNGYSDRRRIIAGVDWTLSYEWLFYISLVFVFSLIKHKVLLLAFIALVIFLAANKLVLTFFLWGFEFEYFFNRCYLCKSNSN